MSLAVTGKAGEMDRNDHRRADILISFWDDVALGRAPADPTLVGEEVADLIARLQALGDLPEQDSARERVWHELEQHPRWKEPDMESAVFSLNGAVAPPSTLPLGPIRPNLPVRPIRWNRSLAEAALVLLAIMALIAGYFSVVRNTRPASPLPEVATPIAEGTPAADWPMYRGNAARTGVMAGPGPDGQPVEVWRFQAQGPASHAPVVAAGVAYLQSGDGNVYALDAANGAERWHVDLGAAENTMAIVGETLYVNDGVGALVALDALNGAERWRFAEGISSLATPIVVDGVLFTASEDSRLLALDATTGEERWHYEANAGIGRSAAVAGGLVYLGTDNGALRVVDAATGEERWRFDSDETTQPTRTPTVANGVVYAPIGSTLYAFDAADGTERWRAMFDGVRPVTTAGETLYTAGLNGVIYALNPADGEVRWTFDTGAANQTAPVPALVGDTLYAISGDYALYALDATTGAERWDLPLDGSEIGYGPSVANGMLYVSTKLGTLYAIGGSGVTQLMAPGTPQPAAPPVGTTIPSATPAASGATVASPWQATGGPDPLLAPAGTAVDADGNIWVVNPLSDVIQIIDADGQFVQEWDGTSGGGEHFNFSKSDGGFDGDIAFAPDGRIYVAEPGSASHRVQVFDRNRQWLATWDEFGTGDGQLTVPQSVAVDAQGAVYVKDNEQQRIQKFDPDGNFLLSIGGPDEADGGLGTDGYIDVDAQGNIVAAGYGTNRIAKFASDGTLLGQWGGIGTEPGQFHTPVDVAVDALGNIYVAEYDNGRIQLLDPQGNPLAVWDAGTTPSGKKNLPYAVALDSAGNLYVAGTGPDGRSEGNIQKFSVVPSLVPAGMATPAA